MSDNPDDTPTFTRRRNHKAIAAGAVALTKARAAYAMALAMSPSLAQAAQPDPVSDVEREVLQALANAKGWAFIGSGGMALSADHSHLAPLVRRRWVEANEAALSGAKTEPQLYRITDDGENALRWMLRRNARFQKTGRVDHMVFMCDGPEGSSHSIRISD